MAKNIMIYKTKKTPVSEQKVEIVERKGTGHPDYIADSIAENFSVSLSNHYIENFGRVLHHNVDKLEVIGGKTEPAFGGGKIIKPISVLFSGRATDVVNGQMIKVKDIAIESAKEWIKRNIRHMDPDSIKWIFETGTGSANLTEAFSRRSRIGSNDTSFGVGYAPLSDTEKIVLETERFLNSDGFKAENAFSGEDVKVMGVRRNKRLELTIAMAFIDKLIPSLADYFEKKDRVVSILKNRLEQYTDILDIEIRLNCMDDKKAGINGCYLTVTGTSAENGDDGAVGRGNRANGLITPNRVMSLEAVAGKNPVNHVGKIYNLFAMKLANEINDGFGIPVEVKMVGRIGTPLSEPIILSIESQKKIETETRKKIISFVQERLSKIEDITSDIIKRRISVC
ncbi:methionine adenosyltransferase [Candidatus Parvarchaeota archaeon]|nr:methionine adenosyltransferase [Candidatus Parvarchaeota archaeon]